jgi:hypothetical protein
MNALVHKLHTWLRQAAPPDEALALVACGLVAYEVFVLAVVGLSGTWEIMAIAHGPRDIALFVVAAVYGIWRVTGKHPACGGEYLRFLARTPWRRGQPLPLGPVHLVLQDFLLLGVLMACGAFAPARPPPALVGAFLFGYLAAFSYLLGATGRVWSFYAIWFGLGLAIRLAWMSGVAPLVVLAATYLVAWGAYWRSLRDFPWQQALADYRNRPKLRVEGLKAASSGQASGEAETEILPPWPFGLLGSSAPARLVNPRHAWVSLALLAWLLYAVAPPAASAEDVHRFALPVLLFGPWVVAGIRLLVYISSHLPPLSLFGRLFTGRLIIGGYDVVFLTPLATAIVGLPLYAGLQLCLLPPQAALGISIAIVLGTALTGPPRLRHWRLTAPLHIWPVGKVAGRIEEV